MSLSITGTVVRMLSTMNADDIIDGQADTHNDFIRALYPTAV